MQLQLVALGIMGEEIFEIGARNCQLGPIGMYTVLFVEFDPEISMHAASLL